MGGLTEIRLGDAIFVETHFLFLNVAQPVIGVITEPLISGSYEFEYSLKYCSGVLWVMILKQRLKLDRL